jgi:hypothetical protein
VQHCTWYLLSNESQTSPTADALHNSYQLTAILMHLGRTHTTLIDSPRQDFEGSRMQRALLHQLSYAPIPLDTDYSAETTNDSATNSAHLLHRFANRPSIDDGASNFASNVLSNLSALKGEILRLRLGLRPLR